MFGIKMFGIICFILVTMLITLFIGCDEVERHKVLSTFFDGVPPLVEERDANDEIVDGNSSALMTGESTIAPNRVDRAHGLARKCSLCHEKLQKSQWAQTQLIKKTPELCYDCHSDYINKGSYFHGPVAIGECKFCHDPHYSQNKALLKDPEPQMCYRCHNQKSIEFIPGHDTDLSSGCSSCHEAHSSSRRKLLRALE